MLGRCVILVRSSYLGIPLRRTLQKLAAQAINVARAPGGLIASHVRGV